MPEPVKGKAVERFLLAASLVFLVAVLVIGSRVLVFNTSEQSESENSSQRSSEQLIPLARQTFSDGTIISFPENGDVFPELVLVNADGTVRLPLSARGTITIPHGVAIRAHLPRTVSLATLVLICSIKELNTLDSLECALSKTQLAAIGRIKKLTHLSINAANLSDSDMRELGNLTNLECVVVASSHMDGHAVGYLPHTVVDLAIDSPNLSSALLAKGLSRLPDIHAFNAPNSSVTDEVILELCSLKKLDRLTLEVSKVTSSGLNMLRKCRQLSSLTLVHPIMPIREMSFLRTLTLTHLKELILSYPSCDNFDVDFLSKCQLQTLALAGPSICSDLSALSGMHSLVDLSLVQTPVTNIAFCAQIPNLNKLCLFGSNITDTSIGEFTRTGSRLRKLDLSFTSTGDVSASLLVAKCSNLQELVMSGTRLTDKGLESLAEITGLQRLHIEKTQTSREATARIMHALPQCDVFSDVVKLQHKQDRAEQDKTIALRFPSKPMCGEFFLLTDAAPVFLCEARGNVSLPRRKLSYHCGRRIAADVLSQLAKLSIIAEVDASNSIVTSEDLRLIAKIPSLATLKLQATTINDETLRPLHETSLEQLELGCTEINGTGLKYLPSSIKLLELGRCSSLNTTETGTLAKNLTRLRRFNAYQIGFSDSDLHEISQLSELEDLCFQGNRVSSKGMEVLSACKKLNTLMVFDCNVAAEHMRFLSHLPKLTCLFLSCDRITNADISFVGRLTKLKKLSLECLSEQHKPVELGLLSRLSELEFLHLPNSSVADVRFITKLTALRELELGKSGVTDQTMCPLFSSRSPLRILNISDTNTGDDTAKAISMQGLELEELNLSGTHLTDRGLGALSALPQLQRLCIKHTSVSSEALADFRRKVPQCQIMQ